MDRLISAMNLEKKAGQWFMLSILALIWGTSFILMKKGLQSFSHSQVAAFRIVISFLLLLPYIVTRLKRVNRKHLKSLLIVGFIGNGIPAFLFTKAQTEVTSSIAGVLNSLTPLFALLVGFMVYKTKFILANIFGVALGLFGAILLILFSSKSGLDIKNFYPLLIVLATIMYAFNVNEVKYHLSDLDGITIVSIAFLFIGPLAGIYLLTSDFTTALQKPLVWLSFGSVFMLALFSSVIATILFNALIKQTTALFASSVTYLIPIVAILWGILDGETIVFLQSLSIMFIILGVYLVNKKAKKSIV